MTKKEIIDTALRGVRAKRIKGESYEPIMPYLLADIMYQIYQSDIAPLKLGHELKRMDSMWKTRYRLFNRPLFSAFHPGAYDELTDLMDSVWDYLSNEITMLRANIIKQFAGIEDFNHRKIVSAFFLCHIFAQYAECAYNRTYIHTKRTSYGTIEEPASNNDLCFLRDLSYRMAMQYIKEIPGGSFEIRDFSSDGIFGVIARKIYKWLKEN